MKKLSALLYSCLICLGVTINMAHAEAVVKEVCTPKVDKTGKAVLDKKTKKQVQDCKKIKVHKKLEGTAVPIKK